MATAVVSATIPRWRGPLELFCRWGGSLIVVGARVLVIRWRVEDDGVRRRLAVAQGALDAAVLRDCEAYVPYDTGELAASGVAEGGSVAYTAGHARRVYYGHDLRFGTGRHPLATAQWFETAKAVHGGEWVLAADAAYHNSREEDA